MVDEDDIESKPPPTRKEKVLEWQLLNSNKAVWLRDPKQVTEEEYTNFYKALAHVSLRKTETKTIIMQQHV